ncbi:MAG: hypothetical protein ACL93V_01045 [Candidatus Electrothrix sp. YB6]
MKNSNAAVVILGLIVFLTAGSAYAGDKGNPAVFGKTYGEWSAEWWQWRESQDPNPLMEEGVVDCSKGQRGPVWFLAGTGGGGPIERECTVPKGKHLFFPLVNLVFYNGPGESYTVDEKRDFLDGAMSDNTPGFFNSRACRLDVTVDEVPSLFSGTAIVRAQSPLFLHHDDSEAVSDGFWVMLRLPEGQHTLHIQGAICDLDSNLPLFEVDVTYNLTVL